MITITKSQMDENIICGLLLTCVKENVSICSDQWVPYNSNAGLGEEQNSKDHIAWKHFCVSLLGLKTMPKYLEVELDISW